MSNIYEIHPKIGVARLGNSPDDFYLSPETIGGLPIEYDQSGCVTSKFVHKYKDSVGRIKRQGQKFRIFKKTDNAYQELRLSDDDIEKIVWTVHIANKKAVWYTFSELQGNLEFGQENSYLNQHVPVNNPTVTDSDERKKLIIDPGPRTIEVPGDVVQFSRYNIPENYEYGSFPPISSGGSQINSLGELRMDDTGNLIALGGYGNVTGDAKIDSFRGAGGYWDDISDGFVMATVVLKDGTKIDAGSAWLIVGSPKYAPELVNITTLYDTMYNVGIRHLKADPTIYSTDSHSNKKEYTPLDGYNLDYTVNYTLQIKPIIERMQSYRWVADVPYLSDFANPGFNLADPSEENKKNRLKYFNYFRVPVVPEAYSKLTQQLDKGPNQLFSSDGIPLMPLNSGDNSVTNSGPIYKFETLSATQYFFMHQWAAGKFVVGETASKTLPEQLDEASVGNCVGAPFSPGIETTWITRNKSIYSAPIEFKLAHHHNGGNAQTQQHYVEYGLSTIIDEAEGEGCEPGDLTKRMAIPWQADFQECTVQMPNITNPTINQFADGTGIEVPPAYYVYWWPPQSPMHIITGSLEPADQVLDAIVSNIAGQPIIPAGQRVPFQRGVNTTQDMINNWNALGFIVNQGSEEYPYFVESERNSKTFGQLAALKNSSQ
ncbi:MAG: CTQ-dependent lysine 6-oxidase LodA [Ectothiorhodospiraceae bacterium]|nr:CTQ-dependent lysine 6-oxidase LodA [Ectothiorhodospiraceae bacterium]